MLREDPMGLTIGQSRKMWRMDSGEFLQRGQEELMTDEDLSLEKKSFCGEAIIAS